MLARRFAAGIEEVRGAAAVAVRPRRVAISLGVASVKSTADRRTAWLQQSKSNTARRVLRRDVPYEGGIGSLARLVKATAPQMTGTERSHITETPDRRPP